jgi:hypothetical protein
MRQGSFLWRYMKYDTKANFIIIHSYNSDPIVEKHPDHHCPSKTAYLVTNGEEFTIDRTSEQKDRYIEKLEEMKNLREQRLNEISDALYDTVEDIDGYEELVLKPIF